MSRWLVAQPGPSWSVHDVYIGWCEALADLGQDVHRFNMDDRISFYSAAMVQVGEPLPDGRLKLRKALDPEQAIELAANTLAASLWKVRPHVLLVVSGFLIPHEILDHARRAYGTRVVVVATEEPYETERGLALAEHADLNLLNDPTHLEKFQAVAPSVYCPQAYREGFHSPGEPDPKLTSDLAFVGTGFPSRRWFLEQMELTGAFDGREVLLAGNWNGVTDDSPLRPLLLNADPNRCTDNADTVRIYRSAQVGMNLYRREGDGDDPVGGWSMGPREVELAATGCFFMRDPRPEGDALFPMLPTFAGPGEAAELLEWWLRHDDYRADAAAKAREAIADRTFHNHTKQLLRLLEKKE